ncbi:hypothetical protein JCM8202_002129 [Rhodotorula sphaerocarpa]
MAIARTPAAHVPAQWHYARLLCVSLPASGLSGPEQAPSPPLLDRATALQVLARVLQDLYGTMGGPVGLGEIDILLIEHSELEGGRFGLGGEGGASEIVIRFPTGATHALLTALPLATSASYRLSCLNHSSNLAHLSGPAGRGKRGYKAWRSGIESRAGTADGAREGVQT